MVSIKKFVVNAKKIFDSLKNNFLRKKLFLHIFVGLVLLFLDGSSKYFASKYLIFEYKNSTPLANNESIFYDNEVGKAYVIPNIPLVPYFLSLEYVRNPNVGFSVLSFLDWWFGPWAKFIIVSSVQITALLWMIFLFYTQRFTFYWSLTLSASGGMGNILNRLYCGYVIDFVKITFPKIQVTDMLIYWPIFNFADVYITLGGILLLRDVLKEKRPKTLVTNFETFTEKNNTISNH